MVTEMKVFINRTAQFGNKNLFMPTVHAKELSAFCFIPCGMKQKACDMECKANGMNSIPHHFLTK